MNYHFTNDWFDCTARSVWDKLIPQINPSNVLEIGSYEGASTCYLIDHCQISDLHCVDSWEGGFEHSDTDMEEVKKRFDFNTKLALETNKWNTCLNVWKEHSNTALPRMRKHYSRYFDLIYIDGSHIASDVLFDAVNAFKLLKIGGTMIFDDYVWNRIDPLNSPKIAIDAFVNIYCRKVELINAPIAQFCVQKTAE